jgi:alpha-glucosidase
MSLRGTPCLYQGDELGLPEVEIAFEDVQDPYGITMWPEFKGRDGCRTPMPWLADAPHLGFVLDGSAQTKPWLPAAQSHRALAVDRQSQQADSLLNFYCNLLRWRKTQEALVQGDLQLLPAHPQVLAYTRNHGAQSMLCVFNFSDTAAQWALPSGIQCGKVCTESGLTGASLQGEQMSLAAWSGIFVQLM